MKQLICVFALLFLATACMSTGFPPQTAEEVQKMPADKRIEISLLPGNFKVAEVEFHVPPEFIPAHILKVAKDAVPDGEVEDCEIEYHGGDKYYEVTFKVADSEWEVMLTEEGKIHRWENSVDPSTVPVSIMKKATLAVKSAKLTKAEQILDGAKNLMEYHFKMEKDGIKYKIVVPLDAETVRVYRETVSEIEVPLLAE
jgi:hypothetical protein